MVVLALCAALGALLLFSTPRLGNRGAALVPPTLERTIGQRAILACIWPLALGLAYLVQPNVAPLWGILVLTAGVSGTAWLYKHRSGTLRERERARSSMAWLWDGMAFALPLALYAATLAPSVLPGDSGEFQIAAPTLGIPHPTGYPLYLVLGRLFSLLPMASVAYRLNLFSAVAAAGAVWAVYRAGRALGLRPTASLLGASLLAVSETFWNQATIAEKYALNALFVALTL